MIPAIFNDFVYIFIPVFLFIKIIWLFTEILNYNDYSKCTGKHTLQDPYKRTIIEHCVWWGTFILMFIDGRLRMLSYNFCNSLFLHILHIISNCIEQLYFYACPIAIFIIEKIARNLEKEDK